MRCGMYITGSRPIKRGGSDPPAASPSGNEPRRRFDATSRALALFTAFYAMLNTSPLYSAHYPFAREYSVYILAVYCLRIFKHRREIVFILLADGFYARETFFSRSIDIVYAVGELIYSSYAATEAINTFHAQVSTTLSTESVEFPGGTHRMKADARRMG